MSICLNRTVTWQEDSFLLEFDTWQVEHWKQDATCWHFQVFDLHSEIQYEVQDCILIQSPF